MKILQVSATDFGGGAAKVAWDLHQEYQASSYESWLAVGKKHSTCGRTFQIPNELPRNVWERVNFTAAQECKPLIGKIKGVGRVSIFFTHLGRPANFISYLQGKELFDYPATRDLLSLVPTRPDIVHCHNLHSKYFDLRCLPILSQQVPTILTLHDTWLLSGHCAYAKMCERWVTGCGSCPDLTLYPAVRRDNTAYNWVLKKKLYEKSKLFVVTPCSWLMNKVKKSILQVGIVDQIVIPNGVDLSLFSPGDRTEARSQLGINQREFVALFVANSVKTNIWKDFDTLKNACEILSMEPGEVKVRFICFGDERPSEIAGTVPIDFIPHTDDFSRLVSFYRAADVYVHAAKADTFPTVILEALACGIPVIATAVDGISEQIKSLSSLVLKDPFSRPVHQYSREDATGVLVDRGDSAGIAHWISVLKNKPELCKQLGMNARRDAELRFDFQRQVREYLSWYRRCNYTFRSAEHGLAKNVPA